MQPDWIMKKITGHGKMVRVVLILLIITLNVGCDQVSKNIVRNNITPHQSIPLFNSHLLLMNIENTGAFLSLGDSLSSTSKNIFLSLLPLLALVAGFIFLVKSRHITPVFSLGLCFVIGGGVGNLFDRIVHGSVTDFLFIHAGIFRTGIFNLADVSIMTGTGIIVLHSLLRTRKSTA
jgi:signal peptidase II